MKVSNILLEKGKRMVSPEWGDLQVVIDPQPSELETFLKRNKNDLRAIYIYESFPKFIAWPASEVVHHTFAEDFMGITDHTDYTELRIFSIDEAEEYVRLVENRDRGYRIDIYDEFAVTEDMKDRLSRYGKFLVSVSI